jgi:hypothetical protein
VRLLSGSTAQFALGGTNGVIVGSNAAGATVTLGQGSVVRDVTIRGAGAGIAANGVGGFALDRVVVENTGGAGISLTNTLGAVALTGLTVRGGAGAGVLINGGSTVSLANSTISGGAGAVDINDGGADLAVSLSGLTLSATGGNVLDIDGSGAGTVTVAGLSGITIRGGTGETGGLSVRSAIFDANTTTAGVQAVNAGRMEVGTTAARVGGQGAFLTDVTGSLSFTDLDIANSGDTGLHVINSKADSFTLATLDGTIDTVGGTAADLDPLVVDLNFASISSVGAAGPGVILNSVQGGGTGGNALTIGTLTISNSGGDGLVILNSTGLVRVKGGAITNSGGSSVRIGTQGVAGSGGITNLAFGASITDAAGASPIVAIFNAAGTINFTGAISGSGSGGIAVQDTQAGSAITFGAITLTGTVGDAITLNNLAGSINFAGLVTIANPGANGIVIGNVPGSVTFGNVDITGLGNFTGLDVTGAHGNVLFNTLDITGTGAGKGIDVTGSTNAGNAIVLNGSIIQGVNIGVDLSQANMTGQFRFGDGDAAVLNSTIAANVPIVIAVLNASNGSYNFADANLIGDTSTLTGGDFTAYYALVGATGAGTRDDPGSLAGADASTAQYIVLLNDSAGGQDMFDAASAGGSFDLAVGQSLVSFLNGDFFAVAGAGIPANLTVSGIGPAGITNVYAGSGGALLTTTTAGSATVNLASNSVIDGLVIRNAGGSVGAEGSGVSNVRIANSDISGANGAIAISDGGTAGSVQLTHLDLASTAGTTLTLSGAGAGTLTVSASDVDIAATGTSAALSIADVTSGGINFGTVSTGTSATGAVSLQNLTGASLVFENIAVGGTVSGEGVAITGSSSAVTAGSISVAGSAGDGVLLANNSGAISIGSINATVSGTIGNGVFTSGGGNIAVGTLAVTGGDVGLAIEDFSGTIAIGGGSISGAEYGVNIANIAAGGSVSIGALDVDPVLDGIGLLHIDGSVAFTGTTRISSVGRAGIVLGEHSTGTITFGDVDITGLGASTTGVYARNASGTVNFNTLDITGSSTTGTRGIDLTGATFATDFITAESGSITGVGIGVDLTDAAITGSFRYGDGSNADADSAASSINAVTPIVITGTNVGTGSYNFRDVALSGDTSPLTTSATLYFVKAGAAGAGTIADPGSLAGAEASATNTIILLNDPTGGQDILDAAGAGGSLDLAAGRNLLSFLGGNTLTLPGGAPANVLLFGIAQGEIGNPFAGSGAPILTTTVAASNTVVLGGGNTIDGVVIRTGATGGHGVAGSGLANVVIRNSDISGRNGAIYLTDSGAAADVALSNLVLASSGGSVLSLNGTGAGTLTVTALDNIVITGGNGETGGLLAADVLFDADLTTAGAQTVVASLTVGTPGARLDGRGVYVIGDGSLDFTSLNVANADGVGVEVFGNGVLTATVDAGSIDTLGDTALTAQNAAKKLAFGSITATDGGIFMDGNTAANAGEPVLDVRSLSLTDGGLILGGSGDYVFANASITDDVGVAVLLTGQVNLDYAGDITSGVGASATVSTFGHGGTASFHDGTIDVTGGDGLQFLDADGTYSFTGTTMLHGGDAGINVANGSSGNFSFGSDTSVTNGAIANFVLQNSDANVTYLGSLTQGLDTDNFVVFAQSGGVLDFSQATISASAGSGLLFLDANGTSMLGDVQLSGGAGIVVTGSSGSISFDNAAITGVGANQIAVDLTGALGNVTFQALDITGTSTVGSKGIDLSGNIGTGDIIVANSSTITGVGVGVDLTAASRTGLFQYGDGESAIDVASTITAVTPLVITGLNGGTGTYNFADVNLVGDNSGLATAATVYYVLAGAAGAGTLSDPGSLAGAEAATSDFIILLNDPTGGQDVINSLGSNGDDTLLLDIDQALRSFRDGNVILLPGGAPANVILTGVVTGQVTNPFAASALTPVDRAPILTTSGAAHTVALSNGSSIDGVFVQSVVNQAAIYGIGRSGVSISNAALSGVGYGLLLEGGGTASATLTNLDVTTLGAGVLLNPLLTGSLTVTGSGINISSSGAGSLLYLRSTTIGAAGLAFGTLTGTGIETIVGINGAVGAGLLSIDTINIGGIGTGAGVTLQGNGAEIDIGTVTVSSQVGGGVSLSGGGVTHIDSLNVTGGARGVSLVTGLDGIYSIDSLTVTGAEYGIFQDLNFTGSLTIGTAAITDADTGMIFSTMNGTTTFTGDVSIVNPVVAGITFQSSTGAIVFDDVDITGLQANGRGIDARLTGGGNVYFETLDITGASATGTRGIDLTGNAAAGTFIVNESSAVTGVGIGVDLTNASRTGTFRYGDGSNIDADLAASTISATTPIVIAGLNGAAGTYDFRDIALVGDTNPLQPSAFFVRAGATGVGSASDPGSLAAADASAATYIVLLDTQTGAGSFDTITGTLTLADNQTLLAFRDTDTFNVGGGAPANVLVFGVTPGTITNPYGTSGAPLLTSADAAGTVQLAGTNVIDGVSVSNTGTSAGVYGNGTAGIATIRNSTISGGGAAVDIRSGALVRTVNLQNLTLANVGNQAGALLNLNGTGGTLIVTGMSNLNIGTGGGETGGLVFNTVTFDSDLVTGGAQAVNAGALTIGTGGARVQGDGLSLTNVSGSLTFSDLDIANNGGTGLLVANSKANSFLLTTLDGSADTTAGTAVNLDPLTVNITLASVTANGGSYGILLDQVEGSFTVTGAIDITGATIAGIAIQDNTAQATPLAATFNSAVSINNTSGAGLSFTNNAGATISFAGGGTGVDVVTSSGAGLTASGGGTISFAGAGNSIRTATGQIANFTGVTAGASGINFASLQSTGVVGAIAINFNNFDSVGGAFSGGTTSIAGTGGGNDAIFIGNGSAANITFGATTIGTGANTVSGDGIEIKGSGNGAVTFTSVDIDNTTAHGVSIIGAAGATGAIAINGGTIGAGGAGSIAGDGVNVTGGGGAVTVAASIAKTSSGNVVEVSSHTGGTVTFSNNISATGGAANGILLSNNTGGSIIFSGASKTLNTGANNAIQFDNNAATGAGVSFTGGNLDIDTTSGRGITGTATTAGAGSLTIQGANNTITSVGGIALNLVNTNIAAGGLNFLSISANGGTRGIVLNNTGAAAGLTVTGTGTTDGSGGTIQNITQRGVELLNTAQVSISNLNLTNASTTGQPAGQDLDITTANGAIYMSGVSTALFNNINITGTIADNGITGINVSNFQLNNSLITGAGDGANESGIEFSNLSGTSSLTNTEIALSATNSLDIVNTDVNLNLTLNNVTFRDTQSSANGEGGLQFRSFSSAGGTPTTNIDVIDSDFLRLRTQGIQIIGEDDSVVSVDITGSVIDSQTGIGAGIDINGNDTSTVRFNIIGNPTIRSSGGAAINISSFISANVMGRIANNADIEVYSQTPAGTGASGSGIRLLAQENSHLVIGVTGNSLTQGAGNNSSAVDVIAREGSARLDLTLTGNVIDSTDANTLADINLQSGSSSGTNIETNQIYANIANNSLTATAAPNLLRLRVSERDNTHDPRIFLQGFVEGGAGIEDDTVATWNANGNTPNNATTSNIAVSLTGTATGPSAGTAQTPTNPLP